ncbi:PilZ domain-containing protein [Hyphococcus sp.]|uniref:PilZ domain-containing protein n=1 Tax=Hyphococcus sp. TaxID=2038636 RepID=UPI003D13AF68
MLKSKPDGAVLRRLQSIKTAPPESVRNLPPREPVTRTSARRHVFKFGLVLTIFEPDIKCIVKNISADGAMIVLEGAIALPERFRLVIDGYSAPAPVRLVWQEENQAGLAFE